MASDENVRDVHQDSVTADLELLRSNLEQLCDSSNAKVYSHDFELTLSMSKEGLLSIIEKLKSGSDFLFRSLIDITAIDYLGAENRFQIVYHLLSMQHNQRLRIKVPVNDGEELPSITSIYQVADWYEREVFDMYGIKFLGHKDLRRILTDYGFRGYPLRKDFPLTGYNEVRYDEARKRVVYEKVSLPQEFRNLDFSSPWEGVDKYESDLSEEDQ